MSGVLTVQAKFSPRYYGFYLAGFQKVLGERVRFSTKGFPEVRDPKDGMALILPKGEKIFIAANDFSEVSNEATEWADVVGQVNLDPHKRLAANVVPIGPSFGTPWETTVGLTSLILRSGMRSSPARIPVMLRDYLGMQKSRSPLSSYVTGESSHDNIYFLANYWSQSPKTNDLRLQFLKGVERVPGITLTGGFWSAGEVPSEYSAYPLDHPVPHSEYLRETRRSMVVFNTPAVHGCLGWKLGEYLALGKAIVSTPLNRRMPGEFRSGQQYHLVGESEDAIADGLKEIAADNSYRRRLEEGARQYWEQHLAPERVAHRLIEECRSYPS